MRIPKTSARVSVSALSAAVLGACALDDTHGTDSDRLFPTARIVLPFDGAARDGPSPAGERRRRFHHGIEVDLSGTAGEFDLSDGIGRTDYSVVHGSLAYRFGIEASRVEVKGLVGVATDRIDLSDNPMVDVEESYFGPMFGVETRVRARDWFEPYARATWSLMERASSSSQLEFGAVFPVVDEFELFVAYRHWRGLYGDAVPVDRDLDARWRGIAIGFGVQF
ncbi:MAG: hypothetical protein KDE27_23505 [Planctomycetes bacterium]|nr:hypothetical protein [Planctomycetota bacterium]